MNASILGLYNYLKIHPKQNGCIEYNGKELTRSQVLTILKFGLENGRKTLEDITDDEVDNILKPKQNESI